MSESMHEMLFTNARIVLADLTIETGWLAVTGGKITAFGEGPAPERGEDLGGDYLIPGLVELHTDHLEAHFMPRPKVYWDPVAAVVSYDGQLATSGITTVLDSLRMQREDQMGDADAHARLLADSIRSAARAGLLRADYLLHLRCEVPMPKVVEETQELIARPEVRLVSLMDHTPGQRQFRQEDKLRAYYRGKTGGMSDKELDELFDMRRKNSERYGAANYAGLVSLAKQHGKPMASHDDTTLEHVRQAAEDGIAIAEFPTTVEAADALHRSEIRVLMGAPNLVRGGSHSGNVATADLARAGLLDILSSDYVPASLLMAAFALPKHAPNIALPEAIRTVTKNPAEAVELHDRGEIARGKRADLVRVHLAGEVPVARAVWREGQRVA